MEEKYREMQRECFLRGKCKRRKKKHKARNEINWTYGKNDIDVTGTCPDEIDDIVNVGFHISRSFSSSSHALML